MSKTQVLAGLGKALSHSNGDPTLIYYAEILILVVIIAYIGYRISTFLKSRR